MASVDGSRSVQISSDQACSNECDPCKYTDIHKEATHYCNDCQEYLCGTCTDSHKGLKLLRNHTLIAVSDLSKQPLSSPDVSCTVLCGCDQNARITDYCESHNAVICHTCKTIKHRKCKTGSINASSASEETLGAVTENANKIQEEIAESIKIRNKDLDSLTIMKESCTNDVESFAEQLKEFVESLKQDALKDVNDCEREQRREIEHQIASLSTTKEMLKKDQNVLQVAIKTGNKSDIFAADIKISKRLEDYRTLLHDISVETKSTEMEFEKNEQLVDIEVAISTLGTLKILEDKKLKGKTFPEL